ncbi:MAG: S24/S26 family peptidase [Deltaproteobacteria bacterium]|nr:S24/S26 family peptidase [Deltaproteobacteria bacterium]
MRRVYLGARPLAALCEAVVGRGGHLAVRAFGASMHPAIGSGDVLVVGPAAGAEPRPGQIVVVGAGQRLLAHRVRLADGRVVVAGDSAGAAGADLGAQRLVGVVRAVRRSRRWRRLLAWSRSVGRGWARGRRQGAGVAAHAAASIAVGSTPIGKGPSGSSAR